MYSSVLQCTPVYSSTIVKSLKPAFGRTCGYGSCCFDILLQKSAGSASYCMEQQIVASGIEHPDPQAGRQDPGAKPCDKQCLDRDMQCAECKYNKMEPTWAAELTRMHLRGGRPYQSPIIRGPLGLSFRIGCVYCSMDKTVRQDAFARMAVCTWSQMQIAFIKRHCRTEAHIKACAAAGIDVRDSDDILKRSIENHVPGVSMMAWALTTCFTASTFVDYRKFVATHELLRDAMPATDDNETVGKYSHQRTCKQCVHCYGSMLTEQDQEFMRKSVRMAIAVDDREPDRVLRMRCLACNPTIEVRDHTAAIVREHGTFAVDCADATCDAIESACTIRQGHRDRITLQSSEDYVDTALVDKCKNTIFQAAADGCEVEVQGMMLLKKRRYCKRLRYFFRDRSHTSQTVHKGTIKTLKPNDASLIELLISAEHSFCKRVRWSRSFKLLWKSVAPEDELAELFEACHHLAYAEQRFDSRSKPMTRLMKHWARVLKVLQLVSCDKEPAHRDDALWAANILRHLSGPEGWQRVVAFCVETDYIVSCRCLTLVQDKSRTDVALAQSEVEETLSVQEALFQECKIFSKERNDSYTWHFLEGTRGSSQLFFASGEVADFAWPVTQKALERPMRLAKSLFEMSRSFLLVNYPDYHWRSRFGCFDCSSHRQPEQMRLDAIEKIAKKEGQDASQVRLHFWEALPIAGKLYEEYGCNTKVWTVIAERQRINPNSPKFKPEKAGFLNCVFTYLGILDVTGDLERLFSKLCWLTLKNRSTQMNLFLLLDCLKVATSLPSDIRLYVSPTMASTTSSTMLRKCVEPGDLIKKAQIKYHEFFGKFRASTSRNVEELGPVERLRHEAAKSKTVSTFRMRKPLMPDGGPELKAGAKISERVRHNMWVQSAKSMVADMVTEKRLKAEGCEVPKMETIFGFELDVNMQQLPKSAYQKAVCRSIKKRMRESRIDFEQEETELGLARSVKPVRTDFRKKAVPKSAPIFHGIALALSKAMVSNYEYSHRMNTVTGWTFLF